VTAGWLVLYLGGALLRALLLMAAAAGIAALARRPLRAGDLRVLAPVLFFVVLTLYPFPDRATLVCPVPLTEPLLTPLHTLSRLRQLAGEGIGLWLTDLTLLPAAMNLLICATIGLALAAQRRLGWRGVAVFAAGGTLVIELTQLTGIWGLYPCAYRQFDVDDLIFNFAGTLGGFALGRGLQRRGRGVRW